MASRFWAAGSDSGSEEDSVDSDNRSADKEKSKVSRWAAVSDSDDSSEEGDRIVRSAKDRAWDGMKAEVLKIRNFMKINDWNGIQAEFESLNKLVEKAKTHLMKDGTMPRFYIKTLADLDDFLMLALKDKDAQKKMNSTNGRALNRMKLTLRRHNKLYESEIATYRDSPDDGEGINEENSETESSSSDSETESSVTQGSNSASGIHENDVATSRGRNPNKGVEELDSDWASSDEDSSSEDEEEEICELKGRAKWLKSASVTTNNKKDRKEKVEKKSKVASPHESQGARVKDALVKVDENLSPEQFDRKILEVVASRGRKGTDSRSLLSTLEKLARLSPNYGYARELSTLMHLVSAQFDTNRSIDEYMDVAAWRACHSLLSRIVEITEKEPTVRLGAIGDSDIADLHSANVQASERNSDYPGNNSQDPVYVDSNAPFENTCVVRVVGNLLSFLLRLEDEYVKSLQRIGPHTHQYVQRLKDEQQLADLADGVQRYYLRISDKAAAATVALLRVEHVYYKHDSIVNAIRDAHAWKATWGLVKDHHPANGSLRISDPKPASGWDSSETHPATWLCPREVHLSESKAPSPTVMMRTLCEYIYIHGDDRCRTRALLCHVSHHALHGRFYDARDLLLMSHLQETAYMSDVDTQILYNRSMALLGICAFREGLMAEAHSCLAEICSSRVKELLAQGVPRFSDKNAEQEKAERRRQTPYHMHINLDLLESCHLTAAMLLEVPIMNLEHHSSSQVTRRPISRYFRKHMDIFNRQVFTGPPENTRDHILAAAKALAIGDWKRCSNLVLGLDVWNLLPGQGSTERVKDLVKARIKADALSTYLFAFSPYYESLSLQQLCRMFELDQNVAHGLVSKMMINGELIASWDQPTATIVLHRLQPTPLQQLALQYAEKTASLVDSNERLLDSRVGGGKDDRNEAGNRRWQQERWRNSKVGSSWKSSDNRNRSENTHYSRGPKSSRGRENRSETRRNGARTQEFVRGSQVRRW